MIEPLLLGALARRGFRAVINTLRYLVRSGCEWRVLRNDFRPYQAVYYLLRQLMGRMPFMTWH